MNSLGFSTAVCLAVLLLCVSCQPTGKPTVAEVEIKPEQVRDFVILYRQNCAGCHGQEGQGSAALGLANPIYLAIASDETIRRVTARGIPGTLMPAFEKSSGGTLTDEQIEVLVREMRARWARPIGTLGATPPPYSATEPGDPIRGATAYGISALAATDQRAKVGREAVPLLISHFSRS
jgi:cytochrome c oxidase cbb3-type subunit 3/ubiquinol-cytochrome c reductase cytochrome c subunit